MSSDQKAKTRTIVDPAPVRGWRYYLELATIVSTLIASLFVAAAVGRGFIRGRQSPQPAVGRSLGEAPLPSEPLSLDGATLRGNLQAKVAIEEFTDYQCPFCGKFARDSLPTVLRDYVDKGKVLYALRNAPIGQMHPFATQAAKAALCAGTQSKYWPMHDAIFQNQQALDDQSLLTLVQTLGMDRPSFSRCIMSSTTSDTLANDIAVAKALRLAGTPTLLAGVMQPDGRLRVTRRQSGFQTAAALVTFVEDLLRSVNQ